MQQALYNKWRPQDFSALKGQDVIRDTLFYAVTHGHMSQAYLFCGPRGTGKTTTARLIAKLLNCSSDADHKPCNTCLTCKTITEGANFDILEVDAASNRGIDEIRQLRDTVRFAPTQAKYKVIIIDEVHMLTREAFNAMLKTLEEPPAYVIFILATTEAHKIPPTIVSRCQRYDFRLATEAVLAEHLLAVAHAEGMALTPEAAQFLARLGEGSFRDALSLLDQVATAQLAEYTLPVVEKLFGYVPQEKVFACLEAILRGDLKSAHDHINDVLAHGADTRAFCDQLLTVSQQAMEAIALDDLSGLNPSLQQIVKQTGLKHMVRWVELLVMATHQMKQSPIARLPLDIAITKYCVTSVVLPERAEIAPAPVVIPMQVKQPVPSPAKEEPAEAPVAVTETIAVPVAVVVPDAIEPEDWASILTQLKEVAPSLVTSLAHAKALGIESDVLQVAVRFKMHADKINQPSNRVKIEQVLLDVLGVPLRIEAQVKKDLPQEEIVDLANIFEFEEEE